MLVAVYGSLKQGYRNHALLGGSEFKGVDGTSAEFSMYSMGGFPCITEGGDTSIHVEVYEVEDEVFSRLDRLEGYPSFYNRKEIDTMYGKAWIYYIQDGSYLGELNLVANGRW